MVLKLLIRHVQASTHALLLEEKDRALIGDSYPFPFLSSQTRLVPRDKSPRSADLAPQDYGMTAQHNTPCPSPAEIVPTLMQISTRRPSISTKSIYHCLWSSHSLNLRQGSVRITRWMPDAANRTRQWVVAANAYSFNLDLRISRSRVLRVFITVLRCCNSLSASSLRSNISFPRVREPKCSVFNFARNGDISALDSVFQAHQASLSDMLPDGTTILHVPTFLSASACVTDCCR